MPLEATQLFLLALRVGVTGVDLLVVVGHQLLEVVEVATMLLQSTGREGGREGTGGRGMTQERKRGNTGKKNEGERERERK